MGHSRSVDPEVKETKLLDIMPHLTANRQRGFITGIALYGAIAVGVLILGLSIACKVQSARLEAVKKELATFQADIKAIGNYARTKKAEKEAADLLLKKGLDHENKLLQADLADARKRLLNAAAGRGRVPEIPASPGSPDEIKVSRADLNGAIRKHVESVRAILGGTANLIVEGAEAVIDLDTGKDFVKLQAVK